MGTASAPQLTLQPAGDRTRQVPALEGADGAQEQHELEADAQEAGTVRRRRRRSAGQRSTGWRASAPSLEQISACHAVLHAV